MAKHRWLTGPLRYVGGRFNSAARYLGDPAFLAVRRQGVPIIHILPLMPPWIRAWKVGTIFDIGANTGQFAVSVSQIFPSAKLYSFEPLPDCYEQLSRRLARIPGACAFNMGLGADSGEMLFERSKSSVSSSFLPMTDAHKTAFPESSGQTQVKVRIARLDDVAETLELVDPLLLKLDVQGYEGHVLRGGERTVRRAKWVIVETSFVSLYEGQPLFDEVYRWMVDRGFKLHGFIDQVTNPTTGETLQADALYIREG